MTALLNQRTTGELLSQRVGSVGPVDPYELLAADRVQSEERLTRLQQDYSGVVEATRDANSDDEHDPEGHTIAYERSQTGALLIQVQQRLTDIDAALARIHAGTYGTCESCNQPISPPRLEARPTARTCISCAGKGHR